MLMMMTITVVMMVMMGMMGKRTARSFTEVAALKMHHPYKFEIQDPRPQQIQCDLFFSRTKKIQCDILFSGPMSKCHISTYKQNSNPRLNQL